MRHRGFTLVEVLVAAGILLVGAVALIEALGYARVHQAVSQHRAQASLYCAEAMDDALRQGYAGLAPGTYTSTANLDATGTPCTITTVVAAENSFLDVTGLKSVTVTATWTETLMRGSPQLQVTASCLLGNPAP